MFTRRITIVRLLGIDVKIDASWLFLAVLVTWSLADNLFPSTYPDQPEATYLLMGIAGALGLFVSIIAHEFGHAIVARRYGIPIEDITLFVFGGVANMKREPDRARDEFFMAIAGPIVSALLSIAGFVYLSSSGASAAVEALQGQGNSEGVRPVELVIAYVSLINGMLAVFNMIPAFPLDGGRVFRAFLWGFTGNLKRATRTAASVGNGFGFFMIMLGVLWIINGAFVSGVWFVLLGLFVRGASQSSYKHVLVKSSLGGQPVSRFMTRTVVSVPPHISLREFVEDYVYRFHHKLYPVVDHGRLYGVIATHALKDLPGEKWAHHRVADVMTHVTAENSVSASTDSMAVLDHMNATGRQRLLVTDGERIVGVISLKDLLEFLTLKSTLEPNA